ncbi:long-chain fatty acid--CoA ligase [Allopusillimonas soli]|uniref:AMP-binding protein n=1 Tax=Allopusillimonas soli TaxID=659016 RepID=A0A853F602_9BURK|nr:AMP-binding protein [Allopusillimonas soli]NYT35975.1 AMP-binding protein [Allopusillimonas soli]TEA76320.1 long-chain fatty acid--CoA ligase [Allopusillimonas soli]
MLTGDMLRRSAVRFPRKIAITYRGPDRRAQVSYAHLDAQANQLAHALLDLGLEKGAKVSMLARNLPEYGAVFFGVARTGCVLNNISVLYAPDELAWTLNKSDTEVLIFDAALADKVAAVRAQCPGIGHYVMIGSSGVDAGTVSFDAFIHGQPDTPPDIVLCEDDAFCMTYTGGTTGRPKGVLASHRARDVTAHTVMVEENIGPRDVVAIVTPLFHVAALNIMFQPAILAGASTVFVTPWSTENFIQAVRDEGVTATFMVPTQANALATLPDLETMGLDSWTKLSFAGAPMPDWVQADLMKRLPRLRLTQIYGQSEVGVIAALPWYRLPEKLGCVGQQPYNVDVAVLRPDGSRTDPGEMGEVASRGDNLMLEYYNEPEQTAAFFKLGNGWGLTGDIGVSDEEGFITLVDRAKDMLISGGENVYPKEIEDAIYQLDEVAECAVFGIPDDRWGELPAAYILLKPGRTLTEEAVIAQCEARLARLKRPRLIKFVDSFPKTPIGKIQKTILKEPYWQKRKKI